MGEYFHHLGELNGQPKGFYVVRDRFLSVDGKRVLAVQYIDEAQTPYAGVACVIRGKYKKFAGVEISDIASLDGLHRQDLERAVREAGFEGIIISLQQE